MAIFILQTVNGLIRHDFVSEAISMVEHRKWRGINDSYRLSSMEELETVYNSIGHSGLYESEQEMIIPVGTIEFIRRYLYIVLRNNIRLDILAHNQTKMDVLAFKNDFLLNVFNIDDCLKPLNVPLDVVDEIYLGRKIINHERPVTDNPDSISISERCASFPYGDYLFIKDNDVIKHPDNGKYPIKKIAEDFYFRNIQVSTLLNDIVAEYRCFVYEGRLKGIQYYSGNFAAYPDIKEVEKIIDSIQEHPKMKDIPYTLDIAVLNYYKRTVVIEMHEFYSCGTYGFSDYYSLFPMFTRTWKNIIVRSNKLLNCVVSTYEEAKRGR